jgi:hypothetical protein
MRRHTLSIALLCFANLALNLCAQDNDKEGDRAERIAELQAQLNKIQAALAKEGIAPVAEERGTIDPTGFQLKEMRRMIDAQRKRIAALKKEHGADSREVARATAELEAIEGAFGEAQPGRGPGLRGAFGATPGIPRGPNGYRGAPGSGSTPGFRGTPGLSDVGGNSGLTSPEYLREMRRTVDDLTKNDNGDPRESAQRGRQLVLEGLEIQMAAVAALARGTEDSGDKEAAAKLRDDLSETAARYVKERRTIQEENLKELVERMGELRKEIENAESTDELIQRLLGEDQGSGGSKQVPRRSKDARGDTDDAEAVNIKADNDKANAKAKQADPKAVKVKADNAKADAKADKRDPKTVTDVDNSKADKDAKKDKDGKK